MAKYTVQQQPVETLLGWIKSGQIAIPEMQRPFVWDSTGVRDLLDSLYNGYPVGYLITWQSVGVRLKDGSNSAFQQILIDGQQRMTALRAALLGEKVVNKRYAKVPIKIAFNPLTEEFATHTPVIRRNPQWIADVSELFNAANPYRQFTAYFAANPGIDEDATTEALGRLLAIKTAQVGVITLDADLDIETVTDIFIRVNKRGVKLSSADFAMSKIASYGELGSSLRKLIDYFCNLAIAPHVFEDISENDTAFAASGYLEKIAWLRNDASDVYDPEYTDVIRVAGLAEFGRGRVAALVSLLSGRDFETRTFSDELAAASFARLESVLLEIVNEYNFTQFTQTILGAGFVEPRLIRSKNALDFAYALFLRLKRQHGLEALPFGQVQKVVQRWFAMSILTARYTGSFESAFEADIRRIEEVGVVAALDAIEQSELSDAFWDFGLIERLETPSWSSPILGVYLAAQVRLHSRGFLSKTVTIRQMLEGQGDYHHLVPKQYLINSGISDRNVYNQIANIALTETPVNIAIKDRAPETYLAIVNSQLETKSPVLGAITEIGDLEQNFAENAIPASLFTTTASSYREFLRQRRTLMSRLLRRYYESL